MQLHKFFLPFEIPEVFLIEKENAKFILLAENDYFFTLFTHFFAKK